MSMSVTVGAARRGRFSIPDRFGHLLLHARRQSGLGAGRLVAIGARRQTDQLGEAGAEGAERRAADREADLGDAEVATAQQRHRPFDASSHQIGVGRLAVGDLELTTEVAGRHVHAASERLDVQRLCVLPVDAVADATQARQIMEVLRRGGSARHAQA
jgi:hypothetical protein